jgi:poly(3-hydroxybutyrate) depolymerase
MIQRRPAHPRELLCAVAALGAASLPVTSLQAATGAVPCAALKNMAGAALGDPTTRLLTATLDPARPADPPGTSIFPSRPMPENCQVTGVMRERTGTDGQHYAIGFRVRLPTVWNGRFLFEGGGGTNGMVGLAVGRLQPGMASGLEQGYAVVSTDTGHDNRLNNDSRRQGQIAFGHDYQARLEYAETALDSVATTAKKIVRAYYGTAPRRSYFAGCSNGGREGMVFAQRFPDQFDGILAAAPAFAVPKAALAEAWDTQRFSAVATRAGLLRKDGLPDMAAALSTGDLALVAKNVADACDALDGLADGSINTVVACTTARIKPALNALVCPSAKTDACLTADQIDALVQSFDGPRNGKGEALYAGWPWDTGISDPGWRAWKLGMGGGFAINVMLGSPALSGLFTTPPSDIGASGPESLRYQLGFDFDRDAPLIFATTPDFPRSGWDLVGAQSTDLARFARHGGKMMVPHGGSDPIFSVNDSIAWWEKLNTVQQGRAARFVRVYTVPGMGHCGGGPSTDQFDALGALVAWVEKGRKPDRILAAAGAKTPWPGRTRPLCAWPAIARYRSGDTEKAASFTCKIPGK